MAGAWTTAAAGRVWYISEWVSGCVSEYEYWVSEWVSSEWRSECVDDLQQVYLTSSSSTMWAVAAVGTAWAAACCWERSMRAGGGGPPVPYQTPLPVPSLQTSNTQTKIPNTIVQALGSNLSIELMDTETQWYHTDKRIPHNTTHTLKTHIAHNIHTLSHSVGTYTDTQAHTHITTLMSNTHTHTAHSIYTRPVRFYTCTCIY